MLELPDCTYTCEAESIGPSSPTPNHRLYLSNLDDQNLLRFSIKYFYLFDKSVSCETLKWSLSRVLVHYYPLAGRLRSSDERKLEVDCNGQGALFAEASMATTAQHLLQSCNVPNKSWSKFIYKIQPLHSFLHAPPLVIQVTSLLCGGMVLCTAINHCLCDGIGTSQFLHAWAHLTKNPNAELTIVPFHCRDMLKPRLPPQVKFRHPGYTRSDTHLDLLKFLQSHPLVPTSSTFTPPRVLCLKKQCVPLLKCTTFEAVAAHTWRSWVRSVKVQVELPPGQVVKLLFSVNVRKRVGLPEGYYGNGFVLACAESSAEELVGANLSHGVKAVQIAKETVSDGEYVRSMVDLLEDKTVKTDLSVSLVISQWSRLGLEEVDLGEGKPLHMGPLTSDIYCLFLPLIGSDESGVRVLVSVPETMLHTFDRNMNLHLDMDHPCP